MILHKPRKISEKKHFLFFFQVLIKKVRSIFPKPIPPIHAAIVTKIATCAPIEMASRNPRVLPSEQGPLYHITHAVVIRKLAKDKIPSKDNFFIVGEEGDATVTSVWLDICLFFCFLFSLYSRK